MPYCDRRGRLCPPKGCDCAELPEESQEYMVEYRPECELLDNPEYGGAAEDLILDSRKDHD